jgi:hypothetical protein
VESDLVIVLDKGNHSKENFTAMRSLVSRVGALVWADLICFVWKKLARSGESYRSLPAFSRERNFAGTFILQKPGRSRIPKCLPANDLLLATDLP